MSDSATLTEPKRITIPYKPRDHFRAMHESAKRFIFLVAHRRAGKSVAMINHTIKQAMLNDRTYPPPRYGYVGPSFAQTKDLIWGYAKHYTHPLTGMGQYNISEGDLQITLPNGAMINLYGGASAYERMRGLYFDGIVLDEFPLLNPSVFSTVVRPCLADYRGWAIVSGTSNGDDHFHELKKKADNDDSWEVFSIPVTQTDALHPDEVIEMTKDMSPEEYAREMLCSFDAPIEGAYYGDLMNDAQPRITGVPYDPGALVYTWWDLGIDDFMEVGFVQRVGRELHAIDHITGTGKGLDYYAKLIREKPYVYGGHILPHDIMARELGTGRSRYEVLSELLDNIIVCPMHRVEDGIQAVRSIIPIMWFDEKKCDNWIKSIRNYHRGKGGKPVHNWASHGADMTRVGAMAIDRMGGMGSNVLSFKGPLRRRIRGLAR